MARKKISEMEEHVGTPAADDWFPMVDKSDLSVAPTGKNKKIRYDAMAGGGSALTYPTFVWDQYTTPFTVANGGGLYLPLDTSSDAVVTDPEGWVNATPDGLEVPAGIYAITWYWEQTDGAGAFFDNYIEADELPGGQTTYPTAPMAHPDSYWGSGSATVKLAGVGLGDNDIRFSVYNRDVVSHNILNIVAVTRLDA